jgi:hypothetical protein
MAVKLDLKFRAIAGLDSQDAEGQPVAHVIDELNGRPLVTGMPQRLRKRQPDVSPVYAAFTE